MQHALKFVHRIYGCAAEIGCTPPRGFGGPGSLGGGFGAGGGRRSGRRGFDVNRPHGSIYYGVGDSALNAAPYALRVLISIAAAHVRKICMPSVRMWPAV